MDEVVLVGRVYGLLQHLLVCSELVIALHVLLHGLFVELHPVVEDTDESYKDSPKGYGQNKWFDLRDLYQQNLLYTDSPNCSDNHND